MLSQMITPGFLQLKVNVKKAKAVSVGGERQPRLQKKKQKQKQKKNMMPLRLLKRVLLGTLMLHF